MWKNLPGALQAGKINLLENKKENFVRKNREFNFSGVQKKVDN